MRVVIMPVDWDTEDEIQEYYSLEKALAAAQADADYYGIAYDVWATGTVNGKEIVQHHEVDPTPNISHPGNYYWDHKGQYEFAAMMED